MSQDHVDPNRNYFDGDDSDGQQVVAVNPTFPDDEPEAKDLGRNQAAVIREYHNWLFMNFGVGPKELGQAVLLLDAAMSPGKATQSDLAFQCGMSQASVSRFYARIRELRRAPKAQ